MFKDRAEGWSRPRLACTRVVTADSRSQVVEVEVVRTRGWAHWGRGGGTILWCGPAGRLQVSRGSAMQQPVQAKAGRRASDRNQRGGWGGRGMVGGARRGELGESRMCGAERLQTSRRRGEEARVEKRSRPSSLETNESEREVQVGAGGHTLLLHARTAPKCVRTGWAAGLPCCWLCLGGSRTQPCRARR